MIAAATIEDLVVLGGHGIFDDGEMVAEDTGYTYRSEKLEIRSEWIPHESGVYRRQDCVQNRSAEPILISTALSRFVLDGGVYTVYTQSTEWCAESRGCWQPLVDTAGVSSEEVRLNSQAAPFAAVFNEQTGRGIAFHLLADSTWQIRVKREYTEVGRRKTVAVELGIAERDFCLELAPGETLELPPILFYPFSDKRDMDAYKLHRYCHAYFPPRSLPVAYNSWMAGFGNTDFAFLEKQLELAASLGAEYFVVDAGWFGPRGHWGDSIGDWEESPDSSLDGKMEELSRLVRAKGLQFGLWFEIERASKASCAARTHPEYYLEENGECFLNFADPKACAYIECVLRQQIRKYTVKWIKFDFNARLSRDPKHRSFLEYFRGYRTVIRHLRAEFPDVYLENCASGGLRMALANLPGFDSFWMSDQHSLYAQAEIYKNTLMRMPCCALEKWVTIRSVPDGPLQGQTLVCGDAQWTHAVGLPDSYLRHMLVGGPIGLSCDLTQISEHTLSLLRDEIARFKEQRPFWMQAECRILADGGGVTALQFNDAAFNEIRIYVYADEPHQNGITVYPECDTAAMYQLQDGGRRSGEDLALRGVYARIDGAHTASEICLLRRSPQINPQK